MLKKLILLLLLPLSGIHTESQIRNHFVLNEDKIDFPYITVTPFTYQASSSIYDKYGPHNLFDANISTYWYSAKNSADEWITVDFNSKRLINGIELDIPTFQGKRAVTSYQIQVMNKGNWETILTENNPGFKNKHAIKNMDASVIRLYIPKNKDTIAVISNFKITLNGKVLNGIDESLTGYLFPVKNGIFPEDPVYLPGAPRVYRNGTHKGIDIHFRKDTDGTPVKLTTADEAVATADGEVVRADLDYEPMTAESYNHEINYTNHSKVTFVEKDFGGRQVWIDHGNGVMTSYNHLSSITKGIKKGKKVKKGEPVGTIGNSGLLGEVKGNQDGIHLHFEIWVNGEFLGKGTEPEQVKKLLQFFFG